MNLEETLEKVLELAREELHIVRKRAEERTPARGSVAHPRVVPLTPRWKLARGGAHGWVLDTA